MVTNAQGLIVQCNDATTAIFGYPMQVLKGHKFNVLMAETTLRSMTMTWPIIYAQVRKI